MEENKVKISLVCKPSVVLRTDTIHVFQKEIQILLNEYFYIDVDNFPNELPLARSISHHIDLIHGSSFPNKASYKMNLKEN